MSVTSSSSIVAYSGDNLGDYSTGTPTLSYTQLGTLQDLTTITVIHVKKSGHPTDEERITLVEDTNFTVDLTEKEVTLTNSTINYESDSSYPDVVAILRVTSISDSAVTFSDNSILTDTDLNIATKQSLFKLQELSEQNAEGYDTTALTLTGTINSNQAMIQTIDSNGWVTTQRIAEKQITKEKVGDNELESSNINMAELKVAMGKLLYPKGSVYFNTVDTRDPAIILGFGTWRKIEGRVLISQDDSDTTFETIGAVGGSKEHQLTKGELPSHYHTPSSRRNQTLWGSKSGTYDYAHNNYFNGIDADGDGAKYLVRNTIGDGADEDGLNNEPHNNLPPYVVVQMWERTDT